MRKDMAKLLTEAERYGSSNPSRKWGKRLAYDPNSDYDDQPTRVSMSRKRQGYYGGKNLSDVLSPLRGFLRKSVGRRWDDVYSELCRNLDRRSVSGLHVFQHVWDFVARHCWMEDGVVRHRHYGVRDFYIHPETGVLCQQDATPSYRHRRRESQRQAPVTKIRLSDTEYLEQMEGIWYYFNRYSVEHEGVTEIEPSYYLRLVKVTEVGEKKLYVVRWTEHAEIKEQLNRKELRRWGLRNQRKPAKPLSRRESRARAQR